MSARGPRAPALSRPCLWALGLLGPQVKVKQTRVLKSRLHIGPLAGRPAVRPLTNLGQVSFWDVGNVFTGSCIWGVLWCFLKTETNVGVTALTTGGTWC